MAKRKSLKQRIDDMSEKIDIDLVFEKILRTAKFERTVECLDHNYSDNWRNFKTAWLNEDFGC